MKVKEDSEKAGLKFNIQKTKIMTSHPITFMAKRWGNSETLFSWALKSLQMVTAAMKLKDAFSWKKSYDIPRQCIQKQRHHFVDTGLYSQSCGFSSSHAQICELDCSHKAGWAPKNWCFQTVVLEKTLESPLDSREIKPVNPKGDESYSLEGLMLKLKLQYFDHLMRRANSLEKTRMWGRWRGAGKEEAVRERDGWMASLTQWTWVWANSGWCEGQGSLVCCRPWGYKESDSTQGLNNEKFFPFSALKNAVSLPGGLLGFWWEKQVIQTAPPQ